VDEYLSERIIKYRSKLQGFSIPEQLFEVWDLEKGVGTKILQTFSIQKKPTIIKTNINTASFKEILSNPYIDYELCIKIFDFKDEVAELQSISEIKNIEGFPLKNYNRIVLYLHAK
jgi:DNA uptake protein ComE-like DNA-binding protein